MDLLKSICIFILLLSYGRTYEEFTTSSKFSEVAKSPAFVDKTLLLKDILRHGRMLITAPRRFMKSTSLQMVKSFLSLPVTENGQPQDRMETESFLVFKNLNIYKKDEHFFYKYFGKFPVIYLDLMVAYPVTTYDEAVAILMRKIHLAYKEHSYLCNSSKLSESEQNLCKVWCDVNEYETLSKTHFYYGLSNLARFLYNHFKQTEVYVLIDEYDALITTAMIEAASNNIIMDIVRLVVGQVGQLMKSNEHVKGGVLTGISHIAGAGFSVLINLKCFHFLNDHDLVDFYGFTENEVEDLFKRPYFKLSEDQINKARLWYNGYTCILGKRIYSPISVINFLISGRVKSFWLQTGNVYNMEVIFKHPSIKAALHELLQNNTVPIEIQQSLVIQDVIKLRDIFIKTGTVVSNPNLLLTYLLELGYLSFAEQKNCTETRVRIPNNEIWDYIFQIMKTYYYDEYNVESEYLKNLNRFNFNKWWKVFSGFAKESGNIVKSLNDAYKILWHSK